MCSESYEDWISIYNDDIKSVWREEKEELRKVSMLYCAFQNELENLKSTLSDQLSQLRLEVKKKDHLEKCKKFMGLAQSERYDDVIINKENETPDFVPLRKIDLNETKNEEMFIESPHTSAFIKDPLPSSQTDKCTIATSPILRKNSFTKTKRKNSTSPSFLFSINTHKVSKTPKVVGSVSEHNTPKNCDDSNIMECSIIEDTPVLKPDKKTKRPRQKLRKKAVFNKSKQASTLTQMFFRVPKTKKNIDSNLPSMTVTEMINLINESSGSETDAELDQSDETIDDLDLSKPAESDLDSKKNKTPDKKEDSPKVIYEEVVRGKERKKLKGWSCQECHDYYEGFNLSPEELQKKKDACSRHRYRFKPNEPTYDGFWDLTFGPTPPTQQETLPTQAEAPSTQREDSEKSIVLSYKKS